VIGMTDVKTLESQHVLQVYRRLPVVFDRGHGVRLTSDTGRSYLDFVSGIGVASLGHAHPGLAQALARQASTLLHTSNLYFHPLQGELATRLANRTGLERAFFCNSGTEAVEACLKFARRYWHTRGETSRTKYLAFTHSFHGRTMGALSTTWDEYYRAPFQPLIPGVSFASADDPAGLGDLVNRDTAAIIVEPIQGEGGVRPISPALAQAIAAACRKTGALLIADEVQSGSGRTGEFLYSPTVGLRPDLVALGKALGAGVPIGAALLSGDVAKTLSPGDHGTTYGGNLLACRAALVFLDALDNGLLDHVRQVSAHLVSALHALAKRQAVHIVAVRGAGLIAGLDLARDAQPVVDAALERGLLVNRTASTVVRLLPPYIVTTDEIDEALPLLEDAIVASGSDSAGRRA
jgi:predicted acetylornithine/succinylornithine family transaminase